MKTPVTLIVAVLAIVGIAGMYLLRTSTPDAPDPVPAASALVPAKPAAPTTTDTAAAADEARRLETAAAYGELEASRQSLQKQLSALKVFLWGRELPAAQARQISHDMMSAQYLLRNQLLLGAFANAAGVHAEKDRVDAAWVRLQEISGELGQ